MNQDLYTLVPTLANAMLALSIIMRVYKRSISAFISIAMVAVSSNLMYYGYVNYGLVSIILLMVVMFYRAVSKPANDTFVYKKYNGVERRNKRRC